MTQMDVRTDRGERVGRERGQTDLATEALASHELSLEILLARGASRADLEVLRQYGFTCIGDLLPNSPVMQWCTTRYRDLIATARALWGDLEREDSPLLAQPDTKLREVFGRGEGIWRWIMLGNLSQVGIRSVGDLNPYSPTIRCLSDVPVDEVWQIADRLRRLASQGTRLAAQFC